MSVRLATSAAAGLGCGGTTPWETESSEFCASITSRFKRKDIPESPRALSSKGAMAEPHSRSEAFSQAAFFMIQHRAKQKLLETSCYFFWKVSIS